MNVDSILKLLGLFNKPIHYIIVGIIIILIVPKDWFICGLILIGLGVSSCIEWIFNYFKKKYRQIEHNNRIKTESLEHKKLIIDKYNKLNDKEKEIIDTCINTNNLRVEKEGYYEALKTLEIKGFGKGLNDTFTIHEKVFEILSEFKNMEALS